ncbi:MAG TPA: phosphoadenosine phosphosulfate reductase family protein [Amycolatopsis sp.]|nr:phosphoadenosine phosphosulfate reductase family protein [Amycolatopsis sp.]
MTNSASGIPATSGRNCGTCTTGDTARASTSGSIRVFPLSNWNELDIWTYIAAEEIELPSIYYAHRRPVVQRDGMLLARTRFLTLLDGEKPYEATVRFRTVGDATCTGCVESSAATPAEVVAEVAATRVTERGATCADDRISETGMEDHRKKEGYF